jgi:hypothetical protein
MCYLTDLELINETQFNKIVICETKCKNNKSIISDISTYKTELNKYKIPTELVGGLNQLVKPYFDIDTELPKDTIFDETLVLTNAIEKIKIMFKLSDAKDIYILKRDKREKNQKYKYSYHICVDNIVISNFNIKHLIDDKNITNFDTGVYDKNRALHSIYTSRKIDKDNFIDLPEFKPYNVFNGYLENVDITKYCPSYITESFVNWNKNVEEMTRGKKLLDAIEKYCAKNDEMINNTNEIVDNAFIENKLTESISKLSEERASSYDTWTKMIWCLSNICKKENISDKSCFNIIHLFSKKASNYDVSGTETFIKSCYDNLREASYSWKYFYDCLKIDDIEYYNSITTLTYSKMKEDFELNHCKIICPPMILYLNSEKKYYISSIKSTKDSYAHMQCKVCVNNKWVNKQFIELWFKDPNIRHYEKEVFEPPPNICNPKYFNTWVDFKISNETLITTGRNYWEEYLTFVNNLFGDKKVVNYLIARYAFKIQNPAKRTYVIVVITGNEGDGKNRFLAPIYNIMNDYTVELPKAKDLFETHAKHEERKLIVLVNEASGSANFENSEVLKTRITEDKLTVNPKGIQAYEIVNRADYDLTGNGEKLVKASDDSTRRFFQTESTGFYNGNIEFFTDYIENIENNPIALRQIYEGFMLYNWKSIVPSGNFQDAKYKPITEVFKRVVNSNRDKIVVFMEDWTKNQLFKSNPKNIYRFTSKCLYNAFNNWCINYNIKCEYSSISFGCRFTFVCKKQFNSNGLDCINKNVNNNVYTFNLEELNKYFEKINGFSFTKEENNDTCEDFVMN